MSDARQDHAPDLGDSSIYRKMSIEELRLLISDAFDEEDIDLESMDAMVDIFCERTGVPPMDVAAAWEEFQRDYMDQVEVYPYEFAENAAQTHRARTNANPHLRSRRLRHRLVAATLAVALVFFLFVTPVGASILNSITNWTSSILWFGDQNIDAEFSAELQSLHEALEEYGVPGKTAPTQLPDGFVFADLSVSTLPDRTVIHAYFMAEARELIVQVIIRPAGHTHSYERDETAIELYKRNDFEHIISKNNDKTNVHWGLGSYEFMITGDISVDEAKQMIDSIYL